MLKDYVAIQLKYFVLIIYVSLLKILLYIWNGKEQIRGPVLNLKLYTHFKSVTPTPTKNTKRL